MEKKETYVNTLNNKQLKQNKQKEWNISPHLLMWAFFPSMFRSPPFPDEMHPYKGIIPLRVALQSQHAVYITNDWLFNIQMNYGFYFLICHTRRKINL